MLVDVVFLSPSYPAEMQQFTRGLTEVGARVWGVGDSHPDAIPGWLRTRLAGYLQVPRIMDEQDVVRRVLDWVRGRSIDRVETNWEPLTPTAATLRERIGIAGMSRDTVLGFRDKPLMRERVARAGLRIPKTGRIRTREEAREAAAEIGFPLILKPVMGAGAADTYRCDDARALEAALVAMGHVEEASIEEFVVGQELTYETICVDGRPVYESVCLYVPNVLDARRNEWISPIIISVRDLSSPLVRPGVELGREVLGALGMGTGFTHMEWYRTASGEAIFGEIACRSPGALMVDVMNFTNDVDLFREWARAVCWGAFEGSTERKYNTAIVFKRAKGQGRITGYSGLDPFLRKYGPHVVRVDLNPVGQPRRDWIQTFLADGHLVVRHPDWDTALRMAEEAAGTIAVYAG